MLTIRPPPPRSRLKCFLRHNYFIIVTTGCLHQCEPSVAQYLRNLFPRGLLNKDRLRFEKGIYIYTSPDPRIILLLEQTNRIDTDKNKEFFQIEHVPDHGRVDRDGVPERRHRFHPPPAVTQGTVRRSCFRGSRRSAHDHRQANQKVVGSFPNSFKYNLIKFCICNWYNCCIAS